MKRFVTLLTLLVGLWHGALAQKSYVTVYCSQNVYGGGIYLSGDIPPSMKSFYDSYDFVNTSLMGYSWIGEVLNLLASNGFSVDKMNTVFETTHSDSPRVVTTYLLSKPLEDSTPDNIRRTEKTDDNSKIHEVARYNLQGMPIDKEEKGVQIVVYSNYTTKTVIKE